MKTLTVHNAQVLSAREKSNKMFALRAEVACETCGHELHFKYISEAPGMPPGRTVLCVNPECTAVKMARRMELPS